MNDKKLASQLNGVLTLLKDTLDAVHESGTPADKTLAAAFRANHAFGSRDRRAASTAVFSFYRRRFWLAKAYGIENAESCLAKSLLACLACEGLDLELAHILCAGCGVDYQEFQKICSLDSSCGRFEAFTGVSVKYSELVPPWTHALFSESAEEKFYPFLDSRPPVWIRVQKGSAQAVGAELAANGGYSFETHKVLHNAVKLKSERPNLYATLLFRRGVFEVQDLSSQCIGFACEPSEGETWLDACAGGGGKTLELASMMNGKGRVCADDIRKYKLDEVLERASRGSFSNIEKADLSKARLYDGVLVDAPCSSSGRWRRNPDAYAFTQEDSVRSLPELQYSILEEKSRFVRPGGVLVYGTCSVFEIENICVVKRFLESRGDEFELEGFVNPHDGGMTDGTLQTWPSDADCDGSFCARFRRKKR